MIIAFSFLSLLNKDYQDSIIKFNNLDSTNWLHFDVMDAKFVTNYTFDYKLVKEINEYNKLYSDVHLMINNPIKYIKDYALNGANQITFHYEAVEKKEVLKVINEIKKYKVKVGISIKPNTDVKVLDEYLPYLDYILIVSVEPGKGGQEFILNSLDKISYLKDKQKDYHYLIGVDGGVNANTIKLSKKAGVDVAVVGTYLANNLNLETLQTLKNE
jgi:ribulose-phosphate 3-epimerase